MISRDRIFKVPISVRVDSKVPRLKRQDQIRQYERLTSFLRRCHYIKVVVSPFSSFSARGRRINTFVIEFKYHNCHWCRWSEGEDGEREVSVIYVCRSVVCVSVWGSFRVCVCPCPCTRVSVGACVFKYLWVRVYGDVKELVYLGTKPFSYFWFCSTGDPSLLWP